jgi:hypothetical protein
MARQRLSFLELHFEKILLGLAAGGLLGVVAWQFVGDKATVTVGTGGSPVPPGDAWPRVEQMAKNLRGGLSAAAVELPAAPTTDILGDFKSRLAARVSPIERLAWTPPAVAMKDLLGSGTIENIKGGKVQLAEMPGLGKAVARAFMATASEAEVDAVAAANPDNRALFPASAPFDLPAVSVEVQFDGTALKAALEKDLDGEGPNVAPPRTWWDTMNVLGLELQRERQTAPGQWGEATTLGALPGRLSLVPAVKAEEPLTLDRLNQLTAEAATREDELQRPEFYRRAELWGNPVGEDWVSPFEASAGGGENTERARLQRELADERERVANLERALARTGAAPGGNQPPRGPGGTGTRPPRGPGGVGPGPSGPNANIEAQRRDIELRLTRAREREQQLVGRLEALGVKPPAAERPSGPRDFSSLLVGPVRLWSHDITAKRGETYRYRLIAMVNNPVYGRGGAMLEKDTELAKTPLKALASEWSDPVTVDPESYVFLVSASTPKPGTGSVSRTSASAEAFTFAYGYWRRGRVVMEPGDAVIAKIEVPDVTKLAAAAPPAPPTQPGRPGAQPPRDDRDAQPGRPGAGAPAEPAARVPTTTVMVVRDEYLLDVAATAVVSPGQGSREVIAAYWRGLGGKIMFRVPENERMNPLYRQLESSALLGEEQLKVQPVAPGGPAAPPQGVPGPGGRPNVPPPPPPPPGGGGGG